jgi:hypothetical protein
MPPLLLQQQQQPALHLFIAEPTAKGKETLNSAHHLCNDSCCCKISLAIAYARSGIKRPNSNTRLTVSY